MKVWLCHNDNGLVHVCTDQDIAYMWLKATRQRAIDDGAEEVSTIIPGINQVQIRWGPNFGDPEHEYIWIEQRTVLNTRGMMQKLIDKAITLQEV